MYVRKMSRSSEGTSFAPTVEVATVAVLFLLALVLARPQLEAWSVQRVFPSLGPVQGYLSSLHGAPTHLFEPLSLGAAQLVSRGAPWGAGFAEMFGGDLRRGHAAVDRAVAQQMAALLVVLSFGAALRAARGLGWSFRILAFVTALLAFLTYEGVVVCIIAIPLFVKLVDFHQD